MSLELTEIKQSQELSASFRSLNFHMWTGVGEGWRRAEQQVVGSLQRLSSAVWSQGTYVSSKQHPLGFGCFSNRREEEGGSTTHRQAKTSGSFHDCGWRGEAEGLLAKIHRGS